MANKPNIQTILSLWRSYELLVLSPDAPPIQIQETKQAFYAGASAMLEMTTEIAKIQNDDEAVVVLEKYHQEFRDFLAAFQAKNKGAH